MFYLFRKSKGHMPKYFSPEEQLKSVLKDDKAVEHFFMANTAEHTLSQYHIFFHVLILVALSFSNDLLLKVILTSAGLISIINSICALTRAGTFMDLKKGGIDKKIIEKLNETKKYKYAVYARVITIVIIFSIYLSVFLHTLYQHKHIIF